MGGCGAATMIATAKVDNLLALVSAIEELLEEVTGSKLRCGSAGCHPSM